VRKGIFMFLLLMTHAAFAQIQHGTIIIFNISKDELVVAADSRQTDVETHGPPNDHYCKIAAFGGQTIFTAVGVTGVSYPGIHWTNIDVARSVIKSVRAENGGKASAHDLASAWGRTMQNNWRSAYLISPGKISQVAETSNGQIAAGMFAQIEGGEIHIEGAAIVVDTLRLEPITLATGPLGDCFPCGTTGSRICAAGKTITTTEEFCRKPNLVLSPPLVSKIDREAALAVEAADFVIAQDKTGEIGGSVDAVELGTDGRLRWRQRKAECPENQN
jgi:hypothetical protein